MGQPAEVRMTSGPLTAKHSPAAQQEVTEAHTSSGASTCATWNCTPPRTVKPTRVKPSRPAHGPDVAWCAIGS